ncbi:hypothetical protein D9M70_497260 [compost metagenome]
MQKASTFLRRGNCRKAEIETPKLQELYVIRFLAIQDRKIRVGRHQNRVTLKPFQDRGQRCIDLDVGVQVNHGVVGLQQAEHDRRLHVRIEFDHVEHERLLKEVLDAEVLHPEETHIGYLRQVDGYLTVNQQDGESMLWMMGEVRLHQHQGLGQVVDRANRYGRNSHGQ